MNNPRVAKENLIPTKRLMQKISNKTEIHTICSLYKYEISKEIIENDLVKIFSISNQVNLFQNSSFAKTHMDEEIVETENNSGTFQPTLY